ncbi:MAG: hypothetical protein OXL37_09255 [Chloroflexota bacterium]|nr:hypothetical protein [Chloroflexota bacterium]MDE2960047.1 hypothetical protein [Chloroflexota bacterium]
MAYVDPSALTPAISGDLPEETRIRLERFPILMSSTLLDAELRAAFQDEQQTYSPSLDSVINQWVLPNRRLDEELAAVSEIVSLPALPLWHLASAMYFQQRQSLTSRQYRLAFITLDEQQETAARELGFFIP